MPIINASAARWLVNRALESLNKAITEHETPKSYNEAVALVEELLLNIVGMRLRFLHTGTWCTVWLGNNQDGINAIVPPNVQAVFETVLNCKF